MPLGDLSGPLIMRRFYIVILVASSVYHQRQPYLPDTTSSGRLTTLTPADVARSIRGRRLLQVSSAFSRWGGLHLPTPMTWLACRTRSEERPSAAFANGTAFGP
ncbi:hypothetical protein B0H12DRAFT_1132678 [Mycena haematopus]|nr:hypothetical protein B0H12DRAFT_1157089 [Mycena haematopus]KAJ7242137.1 hypothetical protein B0H12DRAFT_1132678 [Mycena haematopus]